MSEIQNIQWFPGHMTKTRRMISANMKLVDAVVELIDARIPLSSRNPEIDALVYSKPRLIVMNKCDMADAQQTQKWLNYFKNKGISAIAADCKSGSGLNAFLPAIRKLLSELIAKRKAKGMSTGTLHIMILGIPNVGKSSLINKLAKQKRAKVEDRPGVTRTKQWVKLSDDIELLDTPGVLWPKFEDMAVGERLAFIGSVNDDILDIESLAARLVETLRYDYKENIIKRYSIDYDDNDSNFDIIEKIARKRGMLISGGEVNFERAAITILDEFRSAKLGRITLEHCDG
ncbi:MAG: ribosome biogenesis GTPase YlqF [Oscillospiraceae bacterium]|nr:ribosome biogenesis GTPase YlqF [Oscillospiraceae bacterium]